MGKTFPVNMLPSQWLLKYVWSWYLYSICCMWYALCKRNFQLFVAKKCLLFQKLLASLESPDKHSLLVAVIPLSKMTDFEQTKVLSVPTTKN